MCGLSVYLSGGTTPSSSTAFSGLTLLFSPHPTLTAACGVRPGQRAQFGSLPL